MKNAQQKQEFLATLSEENRLLLGRAFREAEPIEDNLNKDCSLFSMEEIDMVFGRERLKGTRSVAKKCELLTQYTAWVQQQHPIKYATYSTYAEKYNLYIPTFKVDRINPARVYTDDEFLNTIYEIRALYNQMLFLAVYEGVWTSTRVMDFFLLKADDLDVSNNCVHLSSGRQMTVSQNLMTLLVEGAARKSENDAGIFNAAFECVMYRDPTICYKRLNIDPKADSQKNKMRIKNHMQNERKAAQKRLSNPAKFTLQNIQVSGFLNALIRIGVTERFNDNQMYIENPEAGAVADRYDITYRDTQKSNFHRRFEPYFLSAE